MNFYLIFLIFIIYSILGFLLESIYSGILNKKWVNRGFLLGPYCPIYGLGAIILILLLNDIKNVFLVFILSLVISAFIEYIISFVMEKTFHARWWDYSKEKFNLNGRICLSTLIPFAIIGTLIVLVIQPFLINLLLNLNSITMISISAFLLVIFLTDSLISTFLIYRIRNEIKSNNLEDDTEKINKIIKDILFKQSKFNQRILNAYPNFSVIVYKK